MTVMSRGFNEVDLSDPVKAAELVKKQALACGADAVGIGNIDRWKEAPLQMDPKQIMPECKSIIGLVFRSERGTMRGVEEGTFFSNYSAMGYAAVTHMFLPLTVLNLAKFIEDQGYEAVPYGHLCEWRAIDLEGKMRSHFSRPVREGQAAPDVMVHLRIAAYLCGLGEIGYSKMFLSPQFGPRNRVGIVLTDVELAPDPIYDGPKLCNKCMACVRACPGKCFDNRPTVKVNLAGHEVEWIDLDMQACPITFKGTVLTKKEQEEPYIIGEPNTARTSWTPFHHKPNVLYRYGQAICGARGCMRACMISLEARGLLQNKFKTKFRRRPVWSVDWSRESETTDNSNTNE